MILRIKQAEGNVVQEGLEGDQETGESTALANESKEQRLRVRQLRRDLESQFNSIREALQTEDAYSLVLAEHYQGYGRLLRELGEYDEAVEAYVSALHIQRINHGIYSLEQRVLLKELFETHYELGNVEEYEDYLGRILWVEGKNPQLNDNFSFEMLVSVGNKYLDQYLSNPASGTRNVETLLRAKSHFRSAISRHKDKPLSELFLPYGELALISYLESRAYPDVDKSSSVIDKRIRLSGELHGSKHALASYLENSYSRGRSVLKAYLKKASDEKNADHISGALIALGDYHQLFRRSEEALKFYKLAWETSEILPEGNPRKTALITPTPLPAFEYAQQREVIIPNRPSILVPLILTLQGNGKVSEIEKLAEDSEHKKYGTRAKRAAKNLIFRPIFFRR